MYTLRELLAELVTACVAVTLIAAAKPAAAGRPEAEFQAEIVISNAVERGGRLQKSELTFEPRVDVWFAGGSRLTSIGRLRADFADQLEPGTPSNASRSAASGRITAGEQMDFELRELYLDFELGDAQLRLGKQQVVWGQADGLRVLDVINPLSYREFILPDFEDRRIPLWMVNAEVAVAEATLQLLWIPDQTYDEFPEPGATFAFTSPRFRPPLDGRRPVRVDPMDKPSHWLKDSDVGLRLSTFAAGWDLTANYLYHYQDQPVLATTALDQGSAITPSYRRTHLIGASASKAFGDFVFRGELGYSTDRFFASSAEPRGFEESHEISGVVGLDYGGFSNLFISGQYFQSTVPGSSGMLRPRDERSLSLLLRHDFANDTLTVELLAIHNTNASDGLIQFEATYQLTSSVVLTAGADVFYGDAHEVFGQFDERDRFNLQVAIAL